MSSEGSYVNIGLSSDIQYSMLRVFRFLVSRWRGCCTRWRTRGSMIGHADPQNEYRKCLARALGSPRDMKLVCGFLKQ